ncbi:MAG: fumarylacetoacetate hydrolase family protein [Deltaproteobacteria bacterium]|nr:fumarylacetoacetate hydrolase family protein [Deltaproteobacteria bacterium]MBW2393869.1 fumarylacetoacetate hydrolase family protein [Deltaproteobacteria bacterium]
MKRTIGASIVLLTAGVVATVAAAEGLDECLDATNLSRIARVLDPQGRIVYARVTQHEGGHVTRASTLAVASTPLAEVFDRATQPGGREFVVSDEQVCAVVELPEADIDAETRVIVSTGLNYAAHAEEAGGGDVFLFPKPAAPTRPYARVHAPAGVTLLDYEVELAFVLLEDIDPFDPPSLEVLLEKSAFFLSNDVSDREAIIRNAALSGPGTGFVEAKGQPGFMPAGPWMVRGSDLFAAVRACGADGLGLHLWVGDEGEPRQDASTARMILQPDELVARIGTWISEHGRRTPMPFMREQQEYFYPFAVGDQAPKLTAGSIVQTGTPEGVAIHAPNPIGVALRGLLHLRGPFEQFLVEEKARVANGGTRYLAPGDIVRTKIDGLGTQLFEIGEPGERAGSHACTAEDES